ncbi:MarR family winged helix-turn-helix transcriptional regulator [Glycomyces sp. TRM65418]|uniref:MarR family winged helix-turn-helix transcriptional regulator n=1 Tax=Glycomyces sp. TRM65418 TaxID=2867006 RepID=UPI001CE597EC|nr:MarR family winged helix-turn-helix transcriptional regulator [Glycomyces sp. TRM65418]MCC3762688.1 MarR family winged helix-turn-helix transcriptional regulator [Glycomyces sp. TRM65418]QZD56723.1 MarR family winged helix-turn-helix transcriptional regulator [Glycomyces sp. TRM65418]
MTDTDRPVRGATAWARYRRMRQVLDAAVARDLERECDLSLPDYEVLAAMDDLGDQCIRVGALADRMGWAHSRLSRQLGRMQRRGLIDREPCDLDGRGDDVVFTAAGTSALHAAARIHGDAVGRHFADALSERQLEALADIAQSIDDHHATAPDARPSRRTRDAG